MEDADEYEEDESDEDYDPNYAPDVKMNDVMEETLVCLSLRDLTLRTSNFRSLIKGSILMMHNFRR